MLDEHFPIAISLILRQDAYRSECKDLFFCPVFIGQLCLCIHNISDHSAVKFDHKIQLRYKILVSTHDMNKIMFISSRNIHIVKRFSCDLFYNLIV